MPAGFINAADFAATAAGLNAAASAAASQNKGLWIGPRSGGYSISSTVTIPRNVPVQCFELMSYSGPNTSPAVVIGSAGAGNTNNQVRIEGIRVARSISWSGTIAPGVRIINAVGCYITVPYSTNFDVGVEMLGDGDECSGNTVLATTFRVSRIAWVVRATNGGSTKANLFFGGRQTINAAPNSTMPRKYIYTEGGTNRDGNIWLGGDAELRTHESSGDDAVCHFRTGHNLVMGLRQESHLDLSNKPGLLSDGVNSTGNLVWFSWNDMFGSAKFGRRNSAPVDANAVLDQRSFLNVTGIGGFEV